MKKVFLLAITAGLAMSSFAQTKITPGIKAEVNFAGSRDYLSGIKHTTAGKTTDGFDTTVIVISTDSVYFPHIGATDTILNYYRVNVDPANIGTALDSGYLFGTGTFGLTNFAERYSPTSGNNDRMQVLGIRAAFLGNAGSPSVLSADFNVWSEGAPDTVAAHTINSGMPDAVLKTMSVPFSGIGFDMWKNYWFPTPTAWLTDRFFVGIKLSPYTYATIGQDTLSMLLTDNRISASYAMVGADSIINNESVLGLGTNWLDLANDVNITANFYLFPIVNAERDSLHIVSVPGGLKSKNFTFAGNYPNPAVNYTNVVFEVANTTNVTITVTDMAGRTIKTVKNENLAAGKHSVRLETSDLAAGEYVYMVNTTEGGGIASKIVVIK